MTARTNPANASGWVRCAPCPASGSRSARPPGRGRPARPGSPCGTARRRRRRRTPTGTSSSVTSKSAGPFREASSVTRAGPSARRSARAAGSSRSQAASPTRPRKNASTAASGSPALEDEPWRDSAALDRDPAHRRLEGADRRAPVRLGHGRAERHHARRGCGRRRPAAPPRSCEDPEQVLDVALHARPAAPDPASPGSRAGRRRRPGRPRAGAWSAGSCWRGRGCRGRGRRPARPAGARRPGTPSRPGGRSRRVRLGSSRRKRYRRGPRSDQSSASSLVAQAEVGAR